MSQALQRSPPWLGENNVNRTVLARLWGVATMQSFRITYNNGHVEIVAAERYRADGLWIIFEDGDRQEVYRLNERDVRSIDRDHLSDASGPMSA